MVESHCMAWLAAHEIHNMQHYMPIICFHTAGRFHSISHQKEVLNGHITAISSSVQMATLFRCCCATLLLLLVLVLVVLLLLLLLCLLVVVVSGCGDAMLLLLLVFSELVVVANDVHDRVVVIVSNKVTVNFMVFMVCVCTNVRTNLPAVLSFCSLEIG